MKKIEKSKMTTRGRSVEYKHVTVKKKRGTIVTGLSASQLKNREEFLKVREGENNVDYLFRIRNYRQLTEEEKEIISNKPTILIEKSKKEIEKHNNKKRYRQYNYIFSVQKSDFELKFYELVVRYCSVKYGIRVEDFRLMILLYGLRAFTGDELEVCHKLITGKVNSCAYKRFLTRGYISNVVKRKSVSLGKDKIVQSIFYKLSVQAATRMKNFYRYFNEILLLDDNEFGDDLFHPHIQSKINEMNREIRLIETRKKNADSIVNTLNK